MLYFSNAWLQLSDNFTPFMQQLQFVTVHTLLCAAQQPLTAATTKEYNAQHALFNGIMRWLHQNQKQQNKAAKQGKR